MRSRSRSPQRSSSPSRSVTWAGGVRDDERESRSDTRSSGYMDEYVAVPRYVPFNQQPKQSNEQEQPKAEQEIKHLQTMSLKRASVILRKAKQWYVTFHHYSPIE